MTYTPTIKSVKASFAWHQIFENGRYNSVEEANADFDRWLDSILEKVWDEARATEIREIIACLLAQSQDHSTRSVIEWLLNRAQQLKEQK